jgi:hypothetical protein
VAGERNTPEWHRLPKLMQWLQKNMLGFCLSLAK